MIFIEQFKKIMQDAMPTFLGNPYYPWFDFYKGTDGQLTVDFMKVLEEQAEQVSEEEQTRGLTAFYQSVQFENDFFA
ncbi:hypothetical protein LNP00_01660 [Fructobacillus sp. M158]|uniref:hypothetical protein n=1 Tax=Fructobacillus parabroussonetiae TaxID=2713174 RepID=UPI00200A08B6|nr:hypothetical protein [Fructobacillus parabroussonetiae]MCK8617076.1 hypothetical protein [Fructobacillus parabroussonetiae]